MKGNLNFSNSLVMTEQIENKAESVRLESQSLKFVLLDLSGVSKMDPSACSSLGNLSKHLQLEKSLILTTAGVSGKYTKCAQNIA